MSKFRGSRDDPSRPTARPTRRRSRWFLAGALAAGGLVAATTGLTGGTPLAGESDRTVDLDRLSTIFTGTDPDLGDHGDRGGEPDMGYDADKRDHADKGDHGDKGAWNKKDGAEVTSVPCDPNALITALAHANAGGGGTLELAAECTYLLTASSGHAARPAKDGAKPADSSGLPVIHHPIHIKGAGATIARDPDARVFRFFTVPDGGELTLSDLTLKGGRAGSGGSIQVDHGGTAVVERVKIVESAALARDGGGGAIFNDGHMTISESTFSDNHATGTSGKGGGVLNGGVLTVKKSKFSGNTANGFGGGFANFQGAADVSESTFADNRAGEGGGLASVSSRTKVWDLKVTGNTAKIGGGLHNKDATLTMHKVIASHNTSTVNGGGGVSSIQGLLTVDDSTVKANKTRGDGGGIFAQKTNMIVRHSEISQNQAAGHHSKAGGIFAEAGQLALFKSRVTENEAGKKPGGIFAAHARVTVDAETVIAEDKPTNCVGGPLEIPNCFG